MAIPALGIGSGFRQQLATQEINRRIAVPEVLILQRPSERLLNSSFRSVDEIIRRMPGHPRADPLE